LPATATEEERLLADASPSTRRPCGAGCQPALNLSRQVDNLPHGNGMVVIRSGSFEMADWLFAACRSRGMAAVWQRRPAIDRVEGARTAIFDAAELDDSKYEELGRFVAAVRPCPVLALLAFPRIEDHQRALAAGAAVVLSKPLSVEDLFWQIERGTDALSFSHAGLE
jgi:hypothetical protein